MKKIQSIKKQVFITLILLTTINVSAQKHKRFEKIKAHKIAYITDKLDLSSQEAEKFWPIYNQYDKELHQLEIIDRRKIIQSIALKGGIKGLSEKEAQTKLVELDVIEKAIFHKRKEKFKKIEKILSAKKLLLLHKAEKDFKKELLRRLQQKRRKNF